MKYCTKCGKAVEENKKFCTQCGTRYKDGEHQPEGPQINNTTPNNINGPIKPNITLSKGAKVSIGIFVFILIILVSLYQVGNYIFSKEMVIKSFKDSLISADATKISKKLTWSNPSLQMTETSVKQLIKYMKENPSYTENVISSLENQSKNIDNPNHSGAALNVNTEKDYILTKKENKFFIFDNYVIEVRPYYIKLNIRLKDSKVSIEESSTIIAESNNFKKEIGPLMPGVYKLNAQYYGQYAKFEKKINVELICSYGNDLNNTTDSFVELPVNFDEAKFLEIDSKYSDAEVYINGKSTGVLIKDAKTFGPVDLSTKIYAVQRIDGKDIQSDEVKIGNSNYVYLNFAQDEPRKIVTNVNPPIFNIVTASSELKEANYNHEPKNIIDNNKGTAWVEGIAGDGIGQWIKLESDSVQNVSGIKIISGYSKGNDIYDKNNRVAKIIIEFSDGSSSVYDLKDGSMEFQNIDFGKNISTQYIKLTILEVYSGSTYKDTCISEISVY